MSPLATANSTAADAGAANCAEVMPVVVFAPVVGSHVLSALFASIPPNQPALVQPLPNTYMTLWLFMVPSGQPELLSASLVVSPIHAITRLSPILRPAHIGSSIDMRSPMKASSIL